MTRISIDPTALEVAARSLSQGAESYGTTSSRLRSTALPEMPPFHASNVQAALGSLSARLRNVAESLSSTSSDLSRRVAIFRTTEDSTLYMGFLAGLALAAAIDREREDGDDPREDDASGTLDYRKAVSPEAGVVAPGGAPGFGSARAGWSRSVAALRDD